MVLEDLRPRQILTEGAFRNAAAVVLAVSGSINALKHLQAVAVEAGTKVDIYAIWRELQGTVPILSAPRPTGDVRIEEFEDAGGCEAVLAQLGPLVDRSVLTCTGRTLADNLKGATVKDPEIIRPLDNPVSVGPAIAVLRGSLAPESAIVKLGLRGSRLDRFDGPARVYDDSDLAMKDLADGKVRPGEVLVLRGLGVKGGPAMGGGASATLFAIDAAGLADKIAFVTDSQLSGLCLKGLTVAEVAPEAAAGGPLAKLRDGDRIRIDALAGTLDLDVPAEALAARPAPRNAYHTDAPGWLGIYRRDVQPMSSGAVLTDQES
jgi:dihydroxy-acid dehydratase